MFYILYMYYFQITLRLQWSNIRESRATSVCCVWCKMVWTLNESDGMIKTHKGFLYSWAAEIERWKGEERSWTGGLSCGLTGSQAILMRCSTSKSLQETITPADVTTCYFNQNTKWSTLWSLFWTARIEWQQRFWQIIYSASESRIERVRT